jgi:hypothetical protein
MFPSKLRAAVVPVLLVASVGVAAALGVQSARQRKHARAAAVEPAGTAPLAGPTFSYSETAPVEASVPTPDEYAMSAPMQCILHQITRDEGEASWALPEGVVVLSDPPSERPSLVRAYARAHAKGRTGEVAVPAGSGLSILTAGPLLQPSEQIAVRRLSRHGPRIDLEVAHAPYPAFPGEMPAGPNWRPLLLAPLLLPAGSYELTVTWWAFATPLPATRLEDGKPVDQPPLKCEYRFLVPEGVVESPVLRCGGADFQALADGRWRAPLLDRRRAVHLGLRVTNRGDKARIFDPRGLGLFAENLRGADHKPPPYGGGTDHTIRSKPVLVAPGHSHLFLVRAALDSPSPDGPLRLSGTIGAGDTVWNYQGLTPGRYELTLDYGVSPQPLRGEDAYWTGRVRSGTVTAEIVP